MSAKCPTCNGSVYPADPQIVLDSVKFHKACAKCADCSTQITLSNFTKAPDNTLLCKTHYFKRFHEEGNYAGGDQFQRKGAADLRKEFRSSTVSETGSGGFSTVAVVSSSASSVSDKLGSSNSGADEVARSEAVRPLSERLVLDRPVLDRDDLKARRATFGGSKATNLLKPTTGGNKCSACNTSVYPADPQITLDGVKFHKGCAKCADCSTQITLSNFTKTPDHTLLCKTHYFKRFREEGQYAGGEQFKQRGTAEVRADLRKGGSVPSGLVADGAGADDSGPTDTGVASTKAGGPVAAWTQSESTAALGGSNSGSEAQAAGTSSRPGAPTTSTVAT